MSCVSLKVTKNFTSPRICGCPPCTIVDIAVTFDNRSVIVPNGYLVIRIRGKREARVKGDTRELAAHRCVIFTHGLSGCDLRTIRSTFWISSALVTLFVLRDRIRKSLCSCSTVMSSSSFWRDVEEHIESRVFVARRKSRSSTRTLLADENKSRYTFPNASASPT